MPPASSALDLYRAPKTLPSLTPSADRAKVMVPMKTTAGTMSTFRKAKETPTASASMLVAMASGNMVFASKRSLCSSQSAQEKDSRIMFAPMKASRMNAIQWSNRSMRSAKLMPSR